MSEGKKIICPRQVLLTEVIDKWSIYILSVLCQHPLRFNAILRSIEGVTQKTLTLSLRRLERNGMVTRHVIMMSPVGVQYQITDLGRSLQEPFNALFNWTAKNISEVERSREVFDAKNIQD